VLYNKKNIKKNNKIKNLNLKGNFQFLLKENKITNTGLYFIKEGLLKNTTVESLKILC
jgi:hypothetical protein